MGEEIRRLVVRVMDDFYYGNAYGSEEIPLQSQQYPRRNARMSPIEISKMIFCLYETTRKAK